MILDRNRAKSRDMLYEINMPEHKSGNFFNTTNLPTPTISAMATRPLS